MSTTVKPEPLLTDAFLNFSQTIKSPKTKSNYIQALKYYMKFSRIESYDDLLKYSSTLEGLLSIQKNIIMFIEYCKQRGSSYNTIHGYVTGLHHFYGYNDVSLKWKRIKAHLPAKEKRIDDRASDPEARKLSRNEVIQQRHQMEQYMIGVSEEDVQKAGLQETSGIYKISRADIGILYNEITGFVPR